MKHQRDFELSCISFVLYVPFVAETGFTEKFSAT